MIRPPPTSTLFPYTTLFRSLQTPKATSSTLYFDSLTVNAGNGGFLHCIQMDTSVNAANQVVSVGADIAFDADPKFFACLVRFESSSVPTKTQSEPRSEERFSRNAETDLVCRLLLEKKKRCCAIWRQPSCATAW